MLVGKYNKDGKIHRVTKPNNETSCKRHYLLKEEVYEITKDEFYALKKQDKICEFCYKRHLGVY